MSNEENSISKFVVSAEEITILALKSYVKNTSAKQLRLSRYILEEQNEASAESSNEDTADEKVIRPQINSNPKALSLNAF